MDSKAYGVGFYVAVLMEDSEAVENSAVFKALSEIDESGNMREFKSGSTTFQIREVYRTGRSFKGVIAKFRESDLPHIGQKQTRREREIEMDSDEGLIEKNFFLYDSNLKLLTFQVNSSACNINQVSRLFTEALGQTVSFEPVLNEDSARRVMSDDLTPTKLKLGFALPQNPAYYPEDDFSSSMMSMLSSVDGSSCTLNISANAQGKGGARRFLKNTVRGVMSEWANRSEADMRVAQIWFDEQSNPIDLIADRIQGKTAPVILDGRYPVDDKIYSALAEVKGEKIESIRRVMDYVEV